MKEGKLDNEVLENSVLSKLKIRSDEILLGPGVGEDCAAIRFGPEACVVTTDPITGATKGSGRLAVHVSCNDLASSGATPLALTVTLLAPADTGLEQIEAIMEELAEAAGDIGVSVIGGHTEITSAVNRVILSITAIGKTPVEALVTTAGAKPGDYLYMSKTAAVEGTVIIAAEKEDDLKDKLSAEERLELKQLEKGLSVLPEGRIGRETGVSAMHDVTEGGLLGAIWELCEASGTGCTIWKSEIEVALVTKKLAALFDFDPLKLIGSGSMLICAPPERSAALETAAAREGISLRRIGIMEPEPFERRLVGEDLEIRRIEKPDVDPLYRVLNL